jgi:hypothetical protein
MKINGVELEMRDSRHVIVISCDHCKMGKEVEIPKEEVEFLESCGVSDSNIARVYKAYKLDNCYFYCFVKFNCDLCGEPRVLAWESGNSPASHEVISPSEEIRFWPNYNYPTHKIRICKWCMPNNDDEKSRKEFLIKLFDAMLKEEKDNWKWRSENMLK